MAKAGFFPWAEKARTQSGVVSIPRPPPNPALERPMKITPAAAMRCVDSNKGSNVQETSEEMQRLD